MNGRRSVRFQRRTPSQRRAWLLGAASLAFAFSAPACAPKPEAPDPEMLLSARKAALELDISIRQDVLARLERDEDPLAVYVAYRDTVPAMTRDAASLAGLDLSRVALRVRNAANTADDWELRQLEEFRFLIEAGLDAETLEASAILREEIDGEQKRVFRWMRPLVTGEACMVCHGDAIDPRILARLTQDFPLDEATGYYDLELRGAWSVRKVLD